MAIMCLRRSQYYFVLLLVCGFRNNLANIYVGIEKSLGFFVTVAAETTMEYLLTYRAKCLSRCR